MVKDMEEKTNASLGIKEIEINGEEYALSVNIGQIREFTKKIRKSNDDNRVDLILDYAALFLKQGNPDLSDEEIARLTEFNIAYLSEEFPIIIGLSTRKQKEAAKDKQELKN